MFGGLRFWLSRNHLVGFVSAKASSLVDPLALFSNKFVGTRNYAKLLVSAGAFSSLYSLT